MQNVSRSCICALYISTSNAYFQSPGPSYHPLPQLNYDVVVYHLVPLVLDSLHNIDTCSYIIHLFIVSMNFAHDYHGL